MSALHRVAQRLQCHVQPDLVAELEAIGHRLGHVGNPQRGAIHAMLFYAVVQRGRRKALHPQLWVGQVWWMLLVADRDPHLEWRLGCQLMETQRRKQTEHHPRRTACHFHQRGVLVGRVIRQRVQPASEPL